MKKFLLSSAVVALMFGGMFACSEQTKWNREERQAMRDLLRDYRKMVYLENLSEAEYMLFADRVISSVEEAYPAYTTFIEMPAVNDTVQVYVVTTIVEQLEAEASNMRHLYPYRDLVAANILPDGLTRAQQNAFYQCFADAVDNTYSNAEQLVNAIVADTVQTSQIAQMQNACANSLFGWTVEIIEVGD
ncbi:MAG: hypothetical protein IIV16_01320 [Alistipes sp.]|nr:hypothetical protein [Alistipes sp.]